MKRSFIFLAAVAVLAVAVALPLDAATTVSKRIVDEDGKAVIQVRVSAGEFSVYGIDIDGGSIEDIQAPKGWVGITNGNHTIFRTGSKPVQGGTTLTFRLYSSDTDAKLEVTVRDGKNDPRSSRSI